ncbi:hypothetical protein FB451DRAFT_1189697 [Mycena latifolia]|nr:hypothetical protein FB451DRAFT_1189697 [Mycena latifolia]
MSIADSVASCSPIPDWGDFNDSVAPRRSAAQPGEFEYWEVVRRKSIDGIATKLKFDASFKLRLPEKNTIHCIRAWYGLSAVHYLPPQRLNRLKYLYWSTNPPPAEASIWEAVLNPSILHSSPICLAHSLLTLLSAPSTVPSLSAPNYPNDSRTFAAAFANHFGPLHP